MPDVAQRGSAELAAVLGFSGYVKPSQILESSSIVTQARVVELPIGEERAAVTVHAAGAGAEQMQAFDFLIRQSFVVSLNKAVQRLREDTSERTKEAIDCAIRSADTSGELKTCSKIAP